jgi:predicted RNA-binding protein (virulence factor B family)
MVIFCYQGEKINRDRFCNNYTNEILNKQLKLVLKAIPIGICVISDNHNKKFIFSNDVFHKVFKDYQID